MDENSSQEMIRAMNEALVLGSLRQHELTAAAERAEEALRASEESFRGFFENLAVGTAQVDGAGRFLRVNDRYCAITGYCREQLLGGMGPLDLDHPEDREADRERIAQFLGGEVPLYEAEKRYVRKDGEVVWVRVSVSSVRDADGVIRYTAAVIEDITARKQAEETLHESEARFRVAVNMVTNILWTNDAEGMMQGEQPGWGKFTGQKQEEYQGYGWAKAVHPDDAQPTVAAWERAVAEKRMFEFQHRVRRADGEWRLFTIRAVPLLGADGAIREWVGVHTDITERKRAEEGVARLAAIVESSHDALFGEDLDGIITSWNPGAEQIFGYRAEEIVGTSIMRLMPADWQAAEHDLQRQFVAGELGGTFEAIRLAKDGREFPASVSIAPMKDAAGKLIGTSRVLRDITERKRVEEAVRENAALFSTLIAQAPMGTYVVDAQFRVRQVNVEAMTVFASVQPLIGRDFQEVLEIIWGPEVGGKCADIFRHTLATGERYISPPFTEKRHDLGIEQTYEWETQRVTLPEGQHGVVCYFHEVTERAQATAALRASQERMHLAAEATGVGIWEWNVVTNAIRWDALMFRIYGIEPTPDGFVNYEDWSGAVLPEELAENEAILQDTVRRAGQSSREFRIRRRSDGECRHIQAVETVRKNAAGQTEWVVGTNLDITERKEAGLALRVAKEAAEAANAAKDRFLAALSHELRTPLTPVLLLSGVHSQSQAIPEDLREDFEMIHRNVVLEAQLIDDLLDVSRIQQGKMRFTFKPTDVHEAIARSLEMVRAEAEEKDIGVQQELRATPATIEADPARLRQVLSNLLRNALKFTPRGGTVTVRTARESEELQISVSDNGAGIAAADLERIFQPFEQVDAQQKSEHRSLGLGLAISGAIIAAHRGRIWAESPGLGQGATFHVRLPF